MAGSISSASRFNAFAKLAQQTEQFNWKCYPETCKKSLKNISKKKDAKVIFILNNIPTIENLALLQKHSMTVE